MFFGAFFMQNDTNLHPKTHKILNGIYYQKIGQNAEFLKIWRGRIRQVLTIYK